MNPKGLALILAVCLAVGAISIPAWAQKTDFKAQKELETFLSGWQATPKEQEAYRFALQKPDVLKKIPCYCGCLRLGHQDNYNCYYKSGKKRDEIEPHGLECPMCVNITLKNQTTAGNGLYPRPSQRLY